MTTTYDDKDIDRLINNAVERAADRVEQRVEHAAERAAGFYYEKTKHDIGLALEAFEAIQMQVDKIPQIEADVSELKSDMKVVKHAVTATNKDLRSHDKRITKLEKAVFRA